MKKEKIIVTHLNPDLDGLAGAWLLRKFHPEFRRAGVEFCPAGQTLNNKAVDSDPTVVHIDTGGGRFDHHSTSDGSICAAILVWNFLAKEGRQPLGKEERTAVERILDYVLKFDHGLLRVLENEYRDFLPVALLEGKFWGRRESSATADFGCQLLESAYTFSLEKEQFKEDWQKRTEFATPWGKGVGLATAHLLGREFGLPPSYAAAVVIDLKNNHRRFWGWQDTDFSKVYERLKIIDPKADWFLHASKKILLSGSESNPGMRLSKLSLEKMIELVRK